MLPYSENDTEYPVFQDRTEAEETLPVLELSPVTICSRFISWFRQWPNICALIITLIVLVLHLVSISYEDSMMLDENHYIPEAKALLEGKDLTAYEYNPEHPPLGKLLIAAGIDVFGDKPVGWRIASVLFGTASILLFYFICRKLSSKEWLSILATFLFAFENMCFVMSSLAMLDVFYFTFMLAAFLLYLHYRYIPAAIMVALSALVKLNGAFAGGIVLLHWLLVRRKPKRDGALFLIVSPAAFFGLMPLLDRLALSKWLAPWNRLETMQDLSGSLTFASVNHDAESYPWDWILYPDPMWMWYTPTYQSNPNWTLWALTIPLVVYGIYRLIKRDSLGSLAISWFIGTWFIWVPVVLITDRVMFKFYYYPTIGALCLLLAAGIYQILENAFRVNDKLLRYTVYALIVAFLIGHIVVFVLMSPFSSWPPARY